MQILAGMAVVSSPPLAAAVSNAGGLGVIGAGFPNPSPDLLRRMISELKLLLRDPTNFGVDLLIPQVPADPPWPERALEFPVISLSAIFGDSMCEPTR